MKRHIVLLISVLLVSCYEPDYHNCTQLFRDECIKRNSISINYTLVNNYHQTIKVDFTGTEYRVYYPNPNSACGTCIIATWHGPSYLQVSDTSLSKPVNQRFADYYLTLLTDDGVVNFNLDDPNGTIIINPDGSCSCN